MKTEILKDIMVEVNAIKDLLENQCIPWYEKNYSEDGQHPKNIIPGAEKLRDDIFYQLRSQTDWGRNQIKDIIQNLIAGY